MSLMPSNISPLAAYSGINFSVTLADLPRSGPRITAALRNLAICALRLFGRTDVTEATRWAGRSMDRPFTIFGPI